VKILQQTENELFIVHAGKRLQAKLHNNELLWQDGAVWSRLEGPKPCQPPQPEDLLPGMEQSGKSASEDKGEEEKVMEEDVEATDLLGMQERNPSEEDFDPLKVKEGSVQPL